MGQKVSPTCLRLGLHEEWASQWFAPTKQLFKEYLHEDLEVRKFLDKELASAAVSRVSIGRSPDHVRIMIHTARPGVLIGRRGENIQRLQETLQKILGPHKRLKMDYVEVQKPAAEAQLVAQSIAFQLEKRVAFRRAMKRAIQQAREQGALGIKIVCDGRLAGSEMTRRETYRDGKVPLSTFRSDIEYGQATAHTTAGCIGVKVWTYKGDVVRLKPADQGKEPGARRISIPANLSASGAQQPQETA